MTTRNSNWFWAEGPIGLSTWNVICRLMMNLSRKIWKKTTRLVSARAKDKAIYRLQTSPEKFLEKPSGTDFSRSNAGCYRNKKTQSLNCALTHGNLNLNLSWSNYFALDRELPVPDMKMDPERGNRLIHNNVRNSPGWRLMVEFDNAEMVISPFSAYDKNKKITEPYEGITVFASVKRARILYAPNNEVVWSATGDQLKAPPVRSKLSAGESKPYQWPKIIDLADYRPDGPFNDFFLARFYPDRLDERFLQAMFSSRWQYEKEKKSDKEPLGGRFFNPDALEPSWKDVQASLSKFRSWLLDRAQGMPEHFRAEIPVRYINDSVVSNSSCIEFKMAPDSPIRNDSTAKLRAKNKVRECEHQQREYASKYDTCQGLKADLAEAENNLIKAEKAGCTQEKADDEKPEPKKKLSKKCDFSNIPISELQTAIQACLEERCGPAPTSQLTVSRVSEMCTDCIPGRLGCIRGESQI